MQQSVPDLHRHPQQLGPRVGPLPRGRPQHDLRDGGGEIPPQRTEPAARSSCSIEFRRGQQRPDQRNGDHRRVDRQTDGDRRFDPDQMRTPALPSADRPHRRQHQVHTEKCCRPDHQAAHQLLRQADTARPQLTQTHAGQQRDVHQQRETEGGPHHQSLGIQGQVDESAFLPRRRARQQDRAGGRGREHAADAVPAPYRRRVNVEGPDADDALQAHRRHHRAAERELMGEARDAGRHGAAIQQQTQQAPQEQLIQQFVDDGVAYQQPPARQHGGDETDDRPRDDSRER
nr:hypothetical protein [Nocardia arthritidis]